MPSVYKKGGKKNRHGNYYISFRGPDGRLRTQCAWTTDHATALRLARQLENEATEIREGLVDPAAETRRRHEARPLTDHCDDFTAHLTAKGDKAKHVQETGNKVALIFEAADIERISGITLSKVQGAIGALRDKGLAARTCNAYRAAVKSFARWLVGDGRAAVDPLVGLAHYNEDKDRRYIRRHATADELDRLVAAAENGTPYRGGRLTVSGSDRAMLYRVTAATGLREGEVLSLTHRSYDLNDEDPSVTVEATYTKNGEQATQLLPFALAAMLRPWLDTKPKQGQVFQMPEKMARMLRFDLAAAGIEVGDNAGRVLDFYALRHTYCTNVDATGASKKTLQTMTRHKSAETTYRHYVRPRLHAVRTAVEQIPFGGTTAPTSATLRATGTDHQAPDDGSARCSAQCAEQGISGATQCNTDTDNLGDDADDKSLSDTTLRFKLQPGATMPPEGLEPSTRGLRVRCSAN